MGRTDQHRDPDCQHPWFIAPLMPQRPGEQVDAGREVDGGKGQSIPSLSLGEARSSSSTRRRTRILPHGHWTFEQTPVPR